MGVVRAARSAGVAVAVSFTVETDGRLPDGSRLGAAVQLVDGAAPPDWYGVNCAHPTHVAAALDGGSWQSRIAALRPNASTLTHAELDAMEELDEGDLMLLCSSLDEVRPQLPGLSIVGGCCGTDVRHVAALWGSVRRPRRVEEPVDLGAQATGGERMIGIAIQRGRSSLPDGDGPGTGVGTIVRTRASNSGLAPCSAHPRNTGPHRARGNGFSKPPTPPCARSDRQPESPNRMPPALEARPFSRSRAASCERDVIALGSSVQISPGGASVNRWTRARVGLSCRPA